MIWEQIEQWFREILTGGIIDNLSGLFDSVNTEVAEIAGELGTTPGGMERRDIQHDTQLIREHHRTDCGDNNYLCDVL